MTSIAVFLTLASVESLIITCSRVFNQKILRSNVSSSPIVMNSYPCLEEDLVCPFGELAYIKVRPILYLYKSEY